MTIDTELPKTGKRVGKKLSIFIMKWKIFLSALIAMITNVVVSCSKNQKDEFETSRYNKPKELKVSFADIATNQNSTQRILPPSYDDGPGGCSCNSHGGTSAFSVTWKIATCKSDCEKGLGFRCGRAGWLLCRDGTFVPCVAGGNCPQNNNTRIMSAELTFYDDSTVKLTFLNAVPVEEANNTIFEIEQTELVDLPPGMKLDGVHYSGFITQTGNYTINYSDGQYGSVIIAIQLQS